MQESLQLDTMRGAIRQGNANILPLAPAPGFVIITEEIKVQVVKEVPYTVAKQVPIEIEKDGVKKTVVKTVWETQTKPLVETVTRSVPVTVPIWPVVYTSTSGMLGSPSGPLLTASTLTALRHDYPRPGRIGNPRNGPKGNLRQGDAKNPDLAPESLFVLINEVFTKPVEKQIPYTAVTKVPVEIEKDGVKTKVFKPVYETRFKIATIHVSVCQQKKVPIFPLVYASGAAMLASTSGPLLSATTLTALRRDDPRGTDVTTLTGPQVKSHPWQKMLAGRRPEISPLARCVPDDFYFAEFRSLNKLLEAMETSDLWSTHLFNQAVQEARTHRVGERLKGQFAVQTSDLLRPFYDQVVHEVAVTGSDLYLREGSDTTLLFRLKQPELFRRAWTPS